MSGKTTHNALHCHTEGWKKRGVKESSGSRRDERWNGKCRVAEGFPGNLEERNNIHADRRRRGLELNANKIKFENRALFWDRDARDTRAAPLPCLSTPSWKYFGFVAAERGSLDDWSEARQNMGRVRGVWEGKMTSLTSKEPAAR